MEEVANFTDTSDPNKSQFIIFKEKSYQSNRGTSVTIYVKTDSRHSTYTGLSARALGFI